MKWVAIIIAVIIFLVFIFMAAALVAVMFANVDYDETEVGKTNKRTESIKAAQESNKTVYYLKKDGVTLVFDSESAACKYLGVKKCSVSSCRRRNSRCKGYTVSCAKMDGEGDAE